MNEFGELAAELPHKKVTLEKLRAYRQPGTDNGEAIFVRSGLVSKFEMDSSGKRQIIALAFPGETLFPLNGAGIQAIVRSEVLVLPASSVEALIDRHPRTVFKLLRRNEAISQKWIGRLAMRDALQRVAHALCETYVRTGYTESAMLNPFTQQQLGELTGQTSVNVNRVLAQLERDGLIGRKGKRVELVDMHELKQVAAFNGDYLQ
jgi:CRP-like cAMP-binding protein